MVNVFVVGSYVVDLMSRTPHMPKPGETVLGGPFKMGPGGKGNNQAVAAARLGARVTMVTRVGRDVFGDEAVAHFQRENISTKFVTRDDKEPTGAALIAVDDSSENMIVVALGACGGVTRTDVYDAEQKLIQSDVVLVQLETSIDAVQAAVELANKHGKPVILNPAPYQEISDDLLASVTFITPNETEACLLTNIEVTDESSARKAAKLLFDKGVNNVIITLGKKGCFVYDGENEGLLIPGYEVDAVDTTGAGDAFNGALAVSVAKGHSISHAAKFANAVAALAVTKVGTSPAMPYMDDVKDLLENSMNPRE